MRVRLFGLRPLSRSPLRPDRINRLDHLVYGKVLAEKLPRGAPRGAPVLSQGAPLFSHQISYVGCPRGTLSFVEHMFLAQLNEGVPPRPAPRPRGTPNRSQFGFVRYGLNDKCIRDFKSIVFWIYVSGLDPCLQSRDCTVHLPALAALN
jgi:hypothetical protein